MSKITSKKKTLNLIIGLIIVVILIAVGAFYFWRAKTAASNALPAKDAAIVAPVSTSDDINSLESDLQATDPGPDLSNLGKN